LEADLKKLALFLILSENFYRTTIKKNRIIYFKHGQSYYTNVQNIFKNSQWDGLNPDYALNNLNAKHLLIKIKSSSDSLWRHRIA